MMMFSVILSSGSLFCNTTINIFIFYKKLLFSLLNFIKFENHFKLFTLLYTVQWIGSRLSIFPNICNSEYLSQVWSPTLAYNSLDRATS